MTDEHRHVDTSETMTEALRSVVAHANDHHGDELRLAVASRTGQRVRHVAAAQLTELTPRGVELQWVTMDGAHRAVLRFAATARSAEELGALLRRALHPGIC